MTQTNKAESTFFFLSAVKFLSTVNFLNDLIFFG